MFKKVAAANEECYGLPGVNEFDERIRKRCQWLRFRILSIQKFAKAVLLVQLSISMLNCSGLRAIVYGGGVLHILIHSPEF